LAPVPTRRARAVFDHPLLWVLPLYACGIAIRAIYTFYAHPPESFIASDMYFYVTLAKRLASTAGPLNPWDVTHPLGYPMLLALLISGGGSLARVAVVQFVVSCLVPPALGLLGAAAYGRRTGLLAFAFGTLYFPFIEYGALFLSEIHFIFWLAIAFAALFAARRARRRPTGLAFAAAGGVTLSIAAAFKSVALAAAIFFFAVEGAALLLARPDRRARAAGPDDPKTGNGRPGRFARFKPWLLRAGVCALAATPLLAVLTRACTRANRGEVCVTGNKVASDFLLGHYGRIANIEWKPEGYELVRFGSPGAWLRHYDAGARVPFAMTDGPANRAEAWRWIAAHPGEAVVLSLDHVYDTFLGPAMWPSFDHSSWPLAHLSQYVFIAFLFIPMLLVGAALARRGARVLATSRTALVFAPILALAVTVAIATGEVRYRVPFDIFAIVIVSAFVGGDFVAAADPTTIRELTEARA
jgi:hypothetical protein